jgi:glycosyltransferase involved in cell wall biosynthesis
VSLRVLLATGWYFPDSVGGTETYVRGLASGLARRGVDVTIAAPAADGRSRSYEHAGTRVLRYPTHGEPGDAFDLMTEPGRGWLDVLERVRPTTVDVHSLVPGLSLEHVRAARRTGARTVVTLHLPEVLCARGTLMRFGSTPCDGDLRRRPCTACRLDAAGQRGLTGRLAASVPAVVGELVRASPAPQLVKRALGATAVDARRRAWLAALAGASDCIVAPSEWYATMLHKNGIARDRIVLCRQGVEAPNGGITRTRLAHEPLKVGFVGRYEPRKGLHVLIDAAQQVPPHVRIEFHIWGLASTAPAIAYREAMMRRAAGDPRLHFHDGADGASPYSAIDVLVVPSTGFETGPLVVLEAQAAGLPVVGSRLGGIAERVTHESDGLLVPPGDATALATVLCTLAGDPARLSRLRPNAPRSLADVTDETLQLYRGLSAGTAA